MVDFEHQIIEGCIRGEEKAQLALYRLHYKSVYNSCLRILKHSAEAEDTMQEVFIKAFATIGKLTNTTIVAQWLKRIAINMSIDVLRKKKLQLVELDYKLDVEEDAEEDYSEVMLKVESIKSGISQLSEGCRLVLTLNLLEGYDYEEIAGILSISESAVRSQYARGRKQLLKQLDDKKE